MWTRIRICILHFLLIGCYALICTNLFLSLSHYGWDRDNTTKAVFIVAIVATVLGGVVQLFVAPALAIKEYTFKYWNFSTFLFIISSIVQYGIGLHYSHLNERAKDIHQNNTSVVFSDDRSQCTTLEDDYFAFMTYLLPLPIVIFCDVLYPRPDDMFPSSTKVTLVNTFAMLDILDLAQLMFADAGCFQTYDIGWLATFYIALGVSIILLTFSYGLEQQKDLKDGFSLTDLVFTIINLLFNDLLFLILRGYKIYRQKRAYIDVIFISKEVSALVLRTLLASGVYCCFM